MIANEDFFRNPTTGLWKQALFETANAEPTAMTERVGGAGPYLRNAVRRSDNPKEAEGRAIDAMNDLLTEVDWGADQVALLNVLIDLDGQLGKLDRAERYCRITDRLIGSIDSPDTRDELVMSLLVLLDQYVISHRILEEGDLTFPIIRRMLRRCFGLPQRIAEHAKFLGLALAPADAIEDVNLTEQDVPGILAFCLTRPLVMCEKRRSIVAFLLDAMVNHTDQFKEVSALHRVNQSTDRNALLRGGESLLLTPDEETLRKIIGKFPRKETPNHELRLAYSALSNSYN